MTRSTETKHNLSISFTPRYIQHVWHSDTYAIRHRSEWTCGRPDPWYSCDGIWSCPRILSWWNRNWPPFFVQNSQNMACFNHHEEWERMPSLKLVFAHWCAKIFLRPTFDHEKKSHANVSLFRGHLVVDILFLRLSLSCETQLFFPEKSWPHCTVDPAFLSDLKSAFSRCFLKKWHYFLKTLGSDTLTGNVNDYSSHDVSCVILLLRTVFPSAATLRNKRFVNTFWAEIFHHAIQPHSIMEFILFFTIFFEAETNLL